MSYLFLTYFLPAQALLLDSSGRLLSGEVTGVLQVKTAKKEVFTLEARNIIFLNNTRASFYYNSREHYFFLFPWKESPKIIKDKSLGERVVYFYYPPLDMKITVIVQHFEKDRTFYHFVKDSLRDIKRNGFRLQKKEVYRHPNFDDGVFFQLFLEDEGRKYTAYQFALFKREIEKNIIFTFLIPREKWNSKVREDILKLIESCRFLEKNIF